MVKSQCFQFRREGFPNLLNILYFDTGCCPGYTYSV